MIRLEDEDGIDGPFERAVRLPRRRRRATRPTVPLSDPGERMSDLVPPAAPAAPPRSGRQIAPHDGVAMSRTRTVRIPAGKGWAL